MIKYFCDETGKELDMDFPIHENDRLDWNKKEMTIYQDGIIQGFSIADQVIYCKEVALKKFPELNEDDFNSDIWG